MEDSCQKFLPQPSKFGQSHDKTNTWRLKLKATIDASCCLYNLTFPHTHEPRLQKQRQISIAYHTNTAKMWTSAKDFLKRERKREREGAEESLRKLINHSSMSSDSPPEREIFVTIGATATFEDLIRQVGSEEFQQTARELGFTRLTIQCGNSMDFYHEIKCQEVPGLKVKTFGFSAPDLGQEMRGTLKGAGRRKGVVISHAGQCDYDSREKENMLMTSSGAGSILDAMRLCCSIIVVPNESLLDNHQVELAAELEKQGYVIRGSVK